MEDVTYYKNIIYKKNAFEDLKTYIKLGFANKNILLVSTKSIPAEDVTKILNSLICGSENVSHFVARSNFNKKELDELGEKILKGAYGLIVAFGGGKCADVVKYFAYEYNIKYIVCPTVATSLAYFSNYCINPYNASQSFYANMPSRVFIQESIIKNASCYSNICGLCFLHSLRAVYIDGYINDSDKEKYIFAGMEKLFDKLEAEQTNILLCNEDSNLVLMDLLIDFGFFVSMLKKENYYFYNTYQILRSIRKGAVDEFAGRELLVCAKSILFLFKKYIEINTLKVLEKNDYEKVVGYLEAYDISYKMTKNNAFFNNFEQKIYLKKHFLNSKSEIYKEILKHIFAIGVFSKKVKSVYRYGIEVDGEMDDIFKSLFLAPFISSENTLVNFLAGSGVLNSLVAS